ncbi:MAG: dihydrofolate reductase family protein [Actinobacteria bacterium]|nr:dihydrofolate reductase family protein [Actinomycetota bacterium]
MGAVIMHAAVSVDGFIADENDQVGPLFDYYGNGDAEIIEGGEIKVSQASADYLRPIFAGVGAMVIGRRLFDMTNGWEGKPPAGDHVVVVSHRPRPADWRPSGIQSVHPRERQASYYFISDVAQAVAKAKELAGERTVAVTAGEIGGQALALGLVDEVAMDVVPVVFGTGKRYFGSAGGQQLLEDPDTVIQGDRVLHLRYRARR